MAVNNNKYSPNVEHATPFSIRRLNRNINIPQAIDTPPIHPSTFDEYTIHGKRIVRKMTLALFRQCLINHFDIRFQNNSIKWPKQFKTKPSSI